MVAQEKIPLTIKLQKKRDSWEIKVGVAFAQVNSLRNNFNIYKKESTRILERYEQWLEDNNIEPIMDISLYK